MGRWDTGAAQQPGMWFQIELPNEAMVSELQIDKGGASGGMFTIDNNYLIDQIWNNFDTDQQNY